ncbi:porin [Ectothiorhodospira magna]|uniref:Porin n=1 Tax=Ectothiorhodospira magna TaxID=867345 RepID=A0A1H9CFZ5_9GAMM|nr:porin [Ectothiorhodospira magna]SEP99937.1 porin [Ectothiorhodospira magna]
MGSLARGASALRAGSSHYSNENSGSSTVEDAKNKAVSTSLGYSNGPLNVVVAYESQDIYSTDNYDYTADAWRLAASYRITPDFRLAGFYQQTENTRGVEGQEADVFGIAGQYRISPSVYLNAHWFTLDSDLEKRDANLYAIGLEYRVDSALRFYGNLAFMDNDDNSGLTPWGAARSANLSGVEGVDARGETATAFSLGMRYDF